MKESGEIIVRYRVSTRLYADPTSSAATRKIPDEEIEHWNGLVGLMPARGYNFNYGLLNTVRRAVAAIQCGLPRAFASLSPKKETGATTVPRRHTLTNFSTPEILKERWTRIRIFKDH